MTVGEHLTLQTLDPFLYLVLDQWALRRQVHMTEHGAQAQ